MNDNDITEFRSIKEKIRATLQMAKEAEVPKQHQRVGPDKIKPLLFNGFHNSSEKKNEIIDLMYDPHLIDQYSMITIDGGDRESRKRVGSAILFNLLFFDYTGKYIDCSDLAVKIKSIKISEDMLRNDFVNRLKDYYVLFISEVAMRHFSKSWDQGDIFDSLIGSRIDQGKLTILSMADPISSNSTIDTSECGRFLAEYFKKENSDGNLLRIRTQKYVE